MKGTAADWSASRAVLFDDGKGELGPLREVRAAFEVRTGAMLTWERQCAQLGVVPGSVCVPNGLAEVTASRWGVAVNAVPSGGAEDEVVVLVNGRCPLVPVAAVAGLVVGGVLMEGSSGDMIAAVLTVRETRVLLAGGRPALVVVEHADDVLMKRPWDWRRFRDGCIAWDLAELTRGANGIVRLDEGELARRGVTVLGEGGVWAHPSAAIAPSVVIDASAGAVVLEENAAVRAQALVAGPACVGAGSTVLEKSFIKGQTAIGPVCKVAGEVGGTIFQGYSNKAHDGHLGDSYLGEWCNLGAGTVNSNLLNTYGEVIAQATPGARHERTGQTFLGCTLGDHVRTAIGTRIMTGAVVGTGTMWAAGAAMAGTLGAFGWHTDAGHGADGSVFRLAKFFEVANAAMARRGVSMPVAVSRRLTVLHEMRTGVEAISWPGKDRGHLERGVGGVGSRGAETGGAG